MKRGDNKRVKKVTGGAGSPAAASDVEKHGAAETTTDGKGQELVWRVAGSPGEAVGASWPRPSSRSSLRCPSREWFANIDNPRTRRAYRIDIHELMAFMGFARPEEFRKVTRAHVLAWRKGLGGARALGHNDPAKLAALSSLFEHLCDANAVTHSAQPPGLRLHTGRNGVLPVTWWFEGPATADFA
jgi:hypothetical protein